MTNEEKILLKQLLCKLKDWELGLDWFPDESDGNNITCFGKEIKKQIITPNESYERDHYRLGVTIHKSKYYIFFSEDWTNAYPFEEFSTPEEVVTWWELVHDKQ